MSDDNSKHGSSDGGALNLTAEQLIAKLRRALSRDGDFPASAKVVAELRQLANDPRTSASQITEVILKEPSLGMRVLATVNSSYYQRGTQIMTVSQAVLRLGMRTIADLCAGLVLLQKFVPASRRGGAFAACLRKMVLTTLISSSVSSTTGTASSKNTESGYLAGALAEMGTLLLAYYFPQVFENALKRAETKHQELSRSIQELVGVSPARLSTEVVDALNLPDFYKSVLKATETVTLSPHPPQPTRGLLPQDAEVLRCARSLKVALSVSEALTVSGDKQSIDSILIAAEQLGVDDKAMRSALGELPSLYRSHCSLIEVDLPALPDFVSSYKESASAPSATVAQEAPSGDSFKQFVDEIRHAVENREPTASIITSVMESLAWGLKFDRVLLLLVTPNKGSLIGRMLLGKSDVDPKKISRPLGADGPPKNCDAAAFRESHPVYRGSPVLEGGWPFAALPIGSGNRTIGVVYADRLNNNQGELSDREQAAISVLVELLERSVNAQG